MGFLRHNATKIYENGLPKQTILTIHFVQVKPVPDELLPSMARFRFGLTM